MSDPEERFEPITWAREAGDPVPVCPVCNGLLRRREVGGFTTEGIANFIEWQCDLHGVVQPDWVDPRESEDDDER